MRTRQDWVAWSQQLERDMNKRLRKMGYKEYGAASQNAVQKRRIRVAVDSVPGMIARVREMGPVSDDELDDMIQEWLQINHIALLNYNLFEKQSFLICAAAIWILDQIEIEERGIYRLRQFLPMDEKILDEFWRMPDIWDCQYDEDFLLSVVWTIYHRNDETQPISMDEDALPEVLLSEAAATGDYRRDGPMRMNFEGMMAIIPEDKKKLAGEHFLAVADHWADRYLAGLRVLVKKETVLLNRINELCDRFNRMRDEIIQLDKRVREKEKMAQRRNPQKNRPQAPIINPLLAHPEPGISMEELLKNPESWLQAASRAPGRIIMPGSADPEDEEYERLLDGISSTVDQHEAAWKKWEDHAGKIDKFTGGMVANGRLSKELKDRLFEGHFPGLDEEPEDLDVFELCFGLLYLIEQGDDRVWMTGICGPALQEIRTRLPWGNYEYDETEDPVLNGWDDEADKISDTISNPFERKYMPKDSEYPQVKRSFAQILYEETGCLLPRDMHLYDQREKELKKAYGLGKSEARTMLYLMNVLGNSRRRWTAVNLNPRLMETNVLISGKETAEPKKNQEDPEQELARLREENKRLRGSLYETEREAKEIHKELNAVRTEARMEHRELADLREVVFNREENKAAGAEDPPANDSRFPYEVKKETIVFGGHETWLKAIRPMLTGKIRFIDKDLVFDAGLIRHAEMIWVQTNAISHSQYYRITDAARLQKKPVRYFTYASAAAGAEQIMKNDE